MRVYLLLSILITLYSSLAEANCGQRSHDVVFIHGIASNNGAFGYWDKYLEKYHADECIKSHFFEYDTGNNKLSLQDFISSFNIFMHQKFPNIGERKISIVAHSQGGLITLFWLNQMRLERDPLALNVKNIMTMATPYYGAIIATFGYGLRTYALPILGKKELKGMKIGSSLVMRTRELFENTDFQQFIRSKNFVTISAVLKPSWALRDVEGDFAVSPASSNPNTNTIDGISKHYNIFGVHLRFNIFGTPATTRVSKKCLRSSSECDNSSLAIFEKEFLGNQLFRIQEARDINTFYLYLREDTRSPIFVGSENIRRGISFKLIRIRDDIYFYRGKLDPGLDKSKINIFVDGQKRELPIRAGHTSFITH